MSERATRSARDVAVGLDIGATWAKAWLVRATPAGLVAPGEPALEAWNVTGYLPVDLEAQRAGAPLDAAERAAARELVAAATKVILAVCEGLSATPRLAIATAGPKTADERGIELWRRGPRAPHLLDDLLASLATRGFAPEPAPTRLFDDGIAAAAGELFAADGALLGAREALFIGPGTGVAEAYVSGGRLTPWPPELLPAWAEPFPPDTDRSAFGKDAPPADATLGDWIALSPARALESSFRALGLLIHLRIAQLAALGLPPLERIVIGAKGGELLAAESADGPLHGRLVAPLPIVASRLYAAAAIGAVALAR